MKTKNNRLYKRLDKSERKAIENGLDKRKSCRQIAADLGRSASTISDEVSRNRTVSRGENRGERVEDVPTDCCHKLAKATRLKKANKSWTCTCICCILTDNGTEFSDTCSLEKSALPGVVSRCNVYYCDVRASQQKGGCERNHVELRKLLPKRKGISFDKLTKADCAVVMSQLNSEPRPSLNGRCAIDMFRFICKKDASKLLDGLGIEKVDYENLLLSPSVINRERKKRTSA